jgi:hypothetical protein
VVLPKLNGAQFADYKQSEVESREIDFAVSGSFQDNGLYDMRQGKDNKYNKYEQFFDSSTPNNPNKYQNNA